MGVCEVVAVLDTAVDPSTLCLAGSGWTGEGLRLLVGGGCDGPIRCEGATGWTGRPIIMCFV